MIQIKRTQPAPVCLSLTNNYNCAGVLNQLKIDFHNKCYLCEEKHITTIEIDHFIPLSINPFLKLNWDNLFFSCGRCNRIKSNKKDLLDCTNITHEVTKNIRYEITPLPFEKVKLNIEINVTSFCYQETINTINLLNEIYNGSKTENREISSNNLRDKLIKEIQLFHYFIKKYYDSNDQEAKKRIEKKLQLSSPFAAFKYWVIVQNQQLNNDFGNLLNGY